MRVQIGRGKDGKAAIVCDCCQTVARVKDFVNGTLLYDCPNNGLEWQLKFASTKRGTGGVLVVRSYDSRKRAVP